MAAGVSAPVAESDEALVLRVSAGDEAAFTEIYERYFKRVYNFVGRRLSNRADTEETVQEVFINILTSLDGYRGDALFAAWVFGVTRRTIAARFKRKRHATVSLSDEEQEISASVEANQIPSPLEAYEGEEFLAQVETKLNSKLSSEQRHLFKLHHLEDRSISEIAVALDKSENAVKSNLYRARKLLLAR